MGNWPGFFFRVIRVPRLQMKPQALKPLMLGVVFWTSPTALGLRMSCWPSHFGKPWPLTSETRHIKPTTRGAEPDTGKTENLESRFPNRMVAAGEAVASASAVRLRLVLVFGAGAVHWGVAVVVADVLAMAKLMLMQIVMTVVIVMVARQ